MSKPLNPTRGLAAGSLAWPAKLALNESCQLACDLTSIRLPVRFARLVKLAPRESCSLPCNLISTCSPVRLVCLAQLALDETT